MNIGIYIYEQAEVLDFAGPFEVFTKAGSILADAGSDDRQIAVSLIAQSLDAVKARAGFTVLPTASIHQHDALDVLLVPGGWHYDEMHKTPVLDWIKQQSSQVRTTCSVCTGVFLLAQAGVLCDERVTTHWDDIAELRTLFPALTVQENTRWVDEGKIVTSAGISAGIDMSLHLLARLFDRDLALQTARRMEFDWHENKQ